MQRAGVLLVPASAEHKYTRHTQLIIGKILCNHSGLFLNKAIAQYRPYPRLITLIPIAVLVFGVLAGNGIAILVISLYYLLFGFALSRLIYASFANGVFDKYLNPHIEGAQVGQGLRPHTDENDADDEDDEEEDEE